MEHEHGIAGESWPRWRDPEGVYKLALRSARFMTCDSDVAWGCMTHHPDFRWCYGLVPSLPSGLYVPSSRFGMARFFSTCSYMWLFRNI